MSVEFRQRTPGEYARILWNRKWLIVLPTIAVAVAVAWVATVGAGAGVAAGDVAARTVFGEQMQVVVLVVAVGAGLILAARREDFERGEHQ